MTPHITIRHAPAWMLGDFAGKAFGPVILIRAGYEHDRGLLAHELVHVRQFWRTFGLHPLFYWLSKRYRYRAELEAYHEQLRYTNRPELFAHYLADKYGLDVSYTEALADLTAGG